VSWSNSFRWFVPTHGFTWKAREKAADALLVPCSVKIDKPWRSPALPKREYAPLQEFTGLFRTFADTAMTSEAVLQFADRYGCLVQTRFTPEPAWHRPQLEVAFSSAEAERFGWWCEKILEMRRAVMLWDLIQSKNADELSRYIRWQEDSDGDACVKYTSDPDLDLEEAERQEGEETGTKVEVIASTRVYADWLARFGVGDVIEPARLWVKRRIEKHLQDKLAAEMTFTVGEEGLSFECVPAHLLSAMWLQFAMGITRQLDYRSCLVCRNWFELSPETARTNRVFCSDACKSRGYREKQDRARQLFAAKKSFREIAKELGSDVAAVKRWITGKKP
jgi:hypothetical protein